MTTRAAKGGEFGANGEWYEGGKFINTVAANPKRLGSAPKGTGKQQIAPYVWAVPPAAGMRALFGRINGVIGNVSRDQIATIRTDERFPGTLAYLRLTLADAESLIARYNAGERWS